MPNPRFLAFFFAGLAGAVADISLALAQSTPPPAKATPAASPAAAPAKIKPPEMPDIVFYVARGDANACGPGCNEWIAADGKIDREAAQRLRKLVTKPGRRKLPIFFHSPGGSVIGSIELGRLIRNQKMAAAVARTIPSGCDRDKLNQKPCEALKRSGQDLASELDTLTAMCNSGCVYALAGGSVRIVPPFVRLGIHSVGVDSAKSPLRGSELAAAMHNANSHIGEYLHDMGIDAALFAAANAVPHNSVRFLQRDELVRLGIDTREFGETGWRLVAKPTAAIAKTYFARTENEQFAYRNAIVRLGCGAGKTMSLVIGREVGASASMSDLSRPMQIVLGGRRIDLSPGKAAAGGFDVHGANLPVDLFESIKDGSAIEISTVDADRKTARSPAVTLTLDGFAAAFDKLRKSCDAALSVAAFEELKKQQLVVVVPPVWPDKWGGCGSGGATVSFSSRRAAVLSMTEECALKPEDIFKECAVCPEMLVVPTGSFMMGSPESENDRYHDEGPQHRVAFTWPFAAGRFAVTFDEWDACASDAVAMPTSRRIRAGAAPVARSSTYPGMMPTPTWRGYRAGPERPIGC
jgi:hypothetical protein